MKKWMGWGVIIVVCLFFYITRGILLPFIAGLAIAYFLDPVADFLEKKLPRGVAAAIIIGVFFFLLAGIILAFWPVLQGQVASASKTLPETAAKLRPWLDALLTDFSTKTGISLTGNADSFLSNISEQALGKINQALSGIVKSGFVIFNILSLALISPVIAFYLLRDWDHIVARIDSWIPASIAPVVREQCSNVDTVLAGFVRGQIIVSFIMGLLYAIGWSLAGLELALVLGVLAGILAFIPFVGALFAAVIAVTLAIGQWGFDGGHIGFVVLVFVIVQSIEGAFLTPKLVGERVGLHPAWVLFAVFAGGEVLGFVGILVAVPVAAAIAVLVRFIISQYLDHYGLVSTPHSRAKVKNSPVQSEASSDGEGGIK